jgi:hypothetical protein
VSGLVVGGTAIPIATPGGNRGRLDSVDRASAFDGTYRASATGGARREWHFQTPPVTRALADSYSVILGAVAAQTCSGDIIDLPTMCCSEITGWTPIATPAGHYVILDFTLHEVQPAKVLLRYSPGDTITGESFLRSTTALYCDINGVYQSAAIDTKRDGHYLLTTRTLLSEDARTNSCIQSRNLTLTWTKTGTTSQTQTAVGLDGTANSATIIGDTDVGVSSSFNQAWTVGNNNNRHSIAIWFRKDSDTSRFPAVGVALSGGTGVSRQVQLNTQTGAIIQSGAAPVGTGSNRVIETTLWWILEMTLTNNTTGNVTLTVNIYPAAGSVFGTNNVVTGGTCTVGQVNTELNVGFYSSPIFTTTIAVPRGAETYSFPFTTPPQELSVYAKFVEVGRQVAAEFLFEVGNAASASPRFLCYSPGTGFYTSFHEEASGTVTSALAASPALTDTIEIAARLFGDGSDDASQSLNGAAATSSVQSAANALSSAWSGPLVWLNSAGTAGFVGFRAFQSFKIVAGMRSLAEMRTL